MKLIALILTMSLVIADADPRTWTKTDGKKVEAELIRTEPKEAVLKIKNTEYKVPLSSLSEEDNKWIKDNAILEQSYVKEAGRSVLKPVVDSPRLDLSLRCGGKPVVYTLQAKLKRIDFKSTKQVFLIFEGGIGLERTMDNQAVDGTTLFTVKQAPGKARIEQATKTKVISVGDTMTIVGANTQTPLAYEGKSIGLDRVWMITNLDWGRSK